jgi:hypothetical protein
MKAINFTTAEEEAAQRHAFGFLLLPMWPAGGNASKEQQTAAMA